MNTCMQIMYGFLAATLITNNKSASQRRFGGERNTQLLQYIIFHVRYTYVNTRYAFLIMDMGILICINLYNQSYFFFGWRKEKH